MPTILYTASYTHWSPDHWAADHWAGAHWLELIETCDTDSPNTCWLGTFEVTAPISATFGTGAPLSGVFNVNVPVNATWSEC